MVGLFQPIEIGSPWEKIGIDFVGPMPRINNGNKYLIVSIVYFTKFAKIILTRDATALTVAKFLHQNIGIKIIAKLDMNFL